MIIYCVMECEVEGNYLRSIWSSRELAEAECDILHDEVKYYTEFYVDEYTLDKRE